MMRNRKVWGVLGLLLALVVMAGYGQQPIWFLVHGKSGSPRDWTTSVLGQMRAQRPDLFGPVYIADLERQNEVHLFTWAVNLVNEMERHGLLKDEIPDKSVRVLAHSFGGAVTLYILRVAYELERGDVNGLKASIKQACQAFAPGPNRNACDGIGDGVTSVPDKVKWVKAAKKIGEVYLYHPALLGGCAACTGGWGSNDAAASICALGTVGRILWDIPRITWAGQKKIFNIYGFGCGSVGCGPSFCSGNHDKWVKEEHQRLLPESGSYKEVFGGCHCHSDFVKNDNGAAEALVKTISDLNPRPQPTVTLAVRAKCGEDENIQVRIRVNPLPIGRAGEIKTPWRDNYKTGAGVSLTVLEENIKCPQAARFSHWQVIGGTIEVVGSESSKEIYVILPKDTIAIAHYK